MQKQTSQRKNISPTHSRHGSAKKPPCGSLLLPDITIYDTTLRDGEQMPGVSFSPEQKLKIARKLDSVGVPQIEGGFPAVSASEKASLKAICRAGLSADILALSRLEKSDIDAVVDSGADIILLFIATSDVHMKHKLNMTKEEIRSSVEKHVEYAKSRGITVSFSTEDTTRSDVYFLKDLYETAIDCGAVRIGITDTLGCATPEQISRLVKEIRTLTSRPISIHCHNDFGLALANALSGLFAGADVVATTVNGIGERAGNVPLEELAASLKFLYGTDLGIDTGELMNLSKMVSDFSGVSVHRNKPLVGSNAFSHESGIHTAAVLRNPATYEFIPPESVGNKRRLLMGKHTGKTFVENKLNERKLTLDEGTIARILSDVKAKGEENGAVSSNEFWKIVERRIKTGAGKNKPSAE